MSELYKTSLFSDANLVSYYRMEGNSNDSKGSNNGSDTAITYNTDNGKFGQGAGFNGTTSFINLGTAAGLKPTNFSLAVWFKTSTTGAYQGLFHNGADAAHGFQLLILNTNVLFASVNNAVNITGSINVCDGKWHLAVYTYDGTTKKLYLDNVAEGTPQTNSTNPSYDGGSVSIGKRNDGLFHAGTIDDLALFSDALTESEIGYLFRLGGGATLFTDFL